LLKNIAVNFVTNVVVTDIDCIFNSDILYHQKDVLFTKNCNSWFSRILPKILKIEQYFWQQYF